VLNRLKKLSRLNKQLIMYVVDSIILIIVLLASFSVRLGYWYYPESSLILIIFCAPMIAIPIFIRFGLYRTVIRYFEFKALWRIVQAVSLYALVWGVLALMSGKYGIPRSVILINWAQTILAIVGIRIFARSLMVKSKKNFKSGVFKKVLIYGAGDAGVQLVNALEQSSEYTSFGFIDDSNELQNHQINGLKIYSVVDINYLINKFQIDEILIAMPSISKNKRRNIIQKLEKYPVTVKVLPSIAELAEGKVRIDDLREVSIKDLLGRETVAPNRNLLGKNITKKVVLVTGAGGSIGSELSRQILLLKPSALVLYENNELALYNIENELEKINSYNLNIFPILGSVNNPERLNYVFNNYKVDTIYHTAAYKHVPMVEFNTTEGVENNIFGTLNCAQMAIKNSVETFVLISTDKAVRPTNTMGASKRIAELILQALASIQSSTKFSMVRFGNVLGSSGSVIPLFQSQISKGGPITVTDINMVRYFMTIPEAVELVIQAGAMGEGGDVFVLDMGEPVRIYDLAVKMIQLSGLELHSDSNPGGDIEIKLTGLRPGEKLYEELLVGGNTLKTENKLILRAREEMVEWKTLEIILDDLKGAIKISNHIKIRELLIKLVPEFKPQTSIVDLLYKK
jgi:FlaA1/EpsC-like NDP-sugar epimerase